MGDGLQGLHLLLPVIGGAHSHDLLGLVAEFFGHYPQSTADALDDVRDTLFEFFVLNGGRIDDLTENQYIIYRLCKHDNL